MNQTDFEILSELRQDNNFNKINEIDLDAICSICKKILINAYNGPCGCRYCLKCITEYLNSETKICPGNTEDCKVELLNWKKNIHIDQAINKRICRMISKCPNVSCPFKGTLEQLSNHYRFCNIGTTSCPYLNMGCKETKLNNKNLTNHLKMETISHSKFLTESNDNLRNEMEILKKKITELKIENNQFKENVKENQKNILELKSINEEQTRNIEYFSERLETRSISSESSDYSIKISVLEIVLEKKFEVLYRKLDQMITAQNEFVWKIDKFTERNQSAREGRNKMIFSDSFYSHKNGYQICLRMDPDGLGRGYRSHLGLFFCIMKGPFDDILSWPFKYRVVIDIIDQETKESYRKKIKTYEDLPNNRNWNQPIEMKNGAIGYPRFIKLDELIGNNKLLKNDQVWIKCFVDIYE